VHYNLELTGGEGGMTDAFAKLHWASIWPGEPASNDEPGLRALAKRLRKSGIETPLDVRPRPEGDWQTIGVDDARTYRAAAHLVITEQWADDIELPCRVVLPTPSRD